MCPQPQPTGAGLAKPSLRTEPTTDGGEPLDPEQRTGVVITFRDVGYRVKDSSRRGQRVDLLQGVSGYVLPGKLSALMGPSGSGKTTFLDIIAGRKTAGELSGDIRFAGARATRTFLRRWVGYVEQFDTLVPNLTPFEMLMYTVDLKTDLSQGAAYKREKVELAIRQLGLEFQSCRNVLIGSQLARGISGGQAKRVNIGCALVTSPLALFLDEPTSGLDSFTANEVMAVVKALARTGITVAATIHSPSPYCFALFDSLLVLLRGRPVYFGPNGPTAMDFFERHLAAADSPAGGGRMSAAEWMTDVVVSADRSGRAGECAERFLASELSARSVARIGELLAEQAASPRPELAAQLAVRRDTVTPAWFALKTLLKWRMRADYRDKTFILARLVDKAIFSILMMTLYLGIGNDYSNDNALNIGALLFMWTTLPAFTAVGYTPSILMERALYVREQSDGLFRPITYLVFKMIEELALVLAVSLVFSSLVYFPVQLQGSWVVFWLVYLITMSIGVALGYTFAAVSPNLTVANAALPAYVVCLLFFAGCLLRFPQIPDYWIWAAYLDFIRYGWGALVISAFSGNKDVEIGGLPAMQYFDLEGVSKWGFVGIEAAFFVLFFFTAWLALAFKRHGTR